MELNLEDLEAMLSVGGSVGKQGHAGWAVNSLELGKACKALGLELTVMVRFTSGVNRRGTTKVRRRGNKVWHVITLSQIRTKEAANETLWHELTHCWQKEQWAKETGDLLIYFHDKAYKQHNRRGYRNNPWEKHARETAAKNKHWMLLT